jgi:hypothetical protein
MAISSNTTGLRPGVCTSTTRPTAPYEGQLIYTTDLDTLEIWNGSAWRILSLGTPTNGAVLQVATTTKTDTFSTASTSMTDITGLSVSITPKSSTSKVMVMAVVNGTAASTERAGFRIVRDSTAIGLAGTAGDRTPSGFSIFGPSGTNDAFAITSASQNFLDSPSSTSSLTYKIQMYVSTGTGYVNRSRDDGNAFWQPRTVSSITVMEIAA